MTDRYGSAGRRIAALPQRVWGLLAQQRQFHFEANPRRKVVMVTKKLEDDERELEGPFAADRGATPGAGSLAENAEPALCPPCTRSPE